MTIFRIPSRARVHAVLIAAAVALAACAGPSGKWTKAGVGEEARAADLDQCEFVGQAAGLSAIQSNDTYVGVSSTGQLTKTQIPGAGALSYMKQGDAFARCMSARGYKRTAVP